MLDPVTDHVPPPQVPLVLVGAGLDDQRKPETPDQLGRRWRQHLDRSGQRDPELGEEPGVLRLVEHQLHDLVGGDAGDEPRAECRAVAREKVGEEIRSGEEHRRGRLIDAGEHLEDRGVLVVGRGHRALLGVAGEAHRLEWVQGDRNGRDSGPRQAPDRSEADDVRAEHHRPALKPHGLPFPGARSAPPRGPRSGHRSGRPA